MDVDENPDVPSRFAIRGIPTLLLFKGGEVAETVVGVRSKEDLAKMIERHL
jgi:thioredoxin 1